MNPVAASAGDDLSGFWSGVNGIYVIPNAAAVGGRRAVASAHWRHLGAHRLGEPFRWVSYLTGTRTNTDPGVLGHPPFGQA